MKLYLFLFAIAIGLAVAGNSAVERLLAAANNNLSGKMFTRVALENPNTSLVISGFSVLTPLAQLALASDGRTHRELLYAIGLPNENAILTVFSYINRKLKSVPGVVLKMASRIYIPLLYDLNEQFADISKNLMKSEVRKIDFADNFQTAAEINNWVETETNHHIQNLVNPLDVNQDTRALLVNVLYFKGKWNKPFNSRYTARNLFYVNRKRSKLVPTMHITGEYKCGHSYNLEAKILEIPYVGGQSSMIFILPNDVDGIRSLVNKLDDFIVVDREITDISEQEVEVSIPKFKVETTIDLKNILQKMNVKSIFNEEANLEKLLNTSEELFVSQAIQKAFIEVNEEGAEAAAVNNVVIATKSLHIPSFAFNANHPFVFVIRVNNISLFSGVYNG